jgi:hypothetical protein
LLSRRIGLVLHPRHVTGRRRAAAQAGAWRQKAGPDELPQLLATVNATLAARHAAGLSVEVVDVKPQALRDDRVGLFMRLRFYLDDGDAFEVDTLEASDLLRALEVH